MSLLLAAAVLVALAAAVLPGHRPVQALPPRLQAVARQTRRRRAGGLVLGLAVAVLAVRLDHLGRGVLLAVPLGCLCLLGAVAVGEAGVRAPAGSTRSAVLTVRRVRDHVPTGLACAVLGTGALLLAVLVTTTLLGSPDDLGRAGRWLSRQCTPSTGEGRGPFPGSYYTVPVAVVLAAGAALAGVALRAVVHRPWQGEDLRADAALRRQAASAVTAAGGLLVALPLAGVAATAAPALLQVCGPVWLRVLGTALLGALLVAVLLAVRCVAELLRLPATDDVRVEP